MTTLNELNAISPLTEDIETRLFLWFLFLETLIKYRVLVEIEYFIALCEVPLPQLTGVSLFEVYVTL
jgi:adenylosuccinate lyase